MEHNNHGNQQLQGLNLESQISNTREEFLSNEIGSSKYFTIHIHLGGWLAHGPSPVYTGGTSHAWNVDPDLLSYWEILHEVKDKGHSDIKNIYYVLPGKNFEQGLRCLSDQDDNMVREMVDNLLAHGSIHVYVEHQVYIPNTLAQELADKEPHAVDYITDHEMDEELINVEVNYEGDVDTVVGEADAELIDVEWLSDDGDEELQEARKKLKQMRSTQIEEEVVVEEVAVHSEEKRGKRKGSNFDDDANYYFSSSEEGSFITTSDDSDADHAQRRHSKLKLYDPNKRLPEFYLGMVFLNFRQFKEAVIWCSIMSRREIKFKKNDKQRVRAICSDSDCEWRIMASIDGSSKNIMVKTYMGEHSCNWSFTNKMVTGKFLAKYFLKSRGASTLGMKLAEMKDAICTELKVDVSVGQCKRAKRIVLNHLQGNYKEEFSRLWDYADELLKSNPGSSIFIKVHKTTPESSPIFNRIYICFDAMRRGFLAGCRPFIGLDGCFLKGPCKGQILAAVGKDANNQMYPLAWAVVEYESYNSWAWFLEYLAADLGINDSMGAGYTFCSDQHLGLIKAMRLLLPEAEHRYCVRHLFANWRKKHKGQELQKQYWICAKSATVREFEDNVQKMKEIKPTAEQDMMKIDKLFWCRAFFRSDCKCDTVHNNMSESFNGSILEAREMSIIKMLETIRKKIAKRVVDRQKYVEKFKDNFGPSVWQRIEEVRSASANCRVEWGSDKQSSYEVYDYVNTFVVNLELRNCTCRKWDLTGIPCSHAACVIRYRKEKLEDYVSHWYNIGTFTETYQYNIMPVKGMRFWDRTNRAPIQAPVLIRMPGRPKKGRIREEWENRPAGTNICRKGRKMTCKTCFKSGHNSRTCPEKDKGGSYGSRNVTSKGRSKSLLTTNPQSSKEQSEG